MGLLKYKTNYLYLTGLTLLVCGLPVSLFLTSLSQFFLVGSFLFEGNINDKWKRFTSNKVAVFFVGIWIMHLLGLLWTENLAEGIKDLRIKLPLLLLPVIISGTEKLSEKQFRLIMGAFIFSVFAGTVSAMMVYTGIIYREIYDIRDVFIFHISHIRFALFTCVAICTIAYYVGYKHELNKSAKIIAILIAIWFAVFLVIVQSLTGIVILFILTLCTLVYHLFISGNRIKKALSLILIIGLPVTALIYISTMVNQFYTLKKYPVNINDKTALGNDYEFHLKDSVYENGYPVYIYVNYDEMKTAWNKRSKISYDSLDNKGQPMRFTLLRYLTSKGGRKDAEAVNALSVVEVKAVENGIANVNFLKMSDLRTRVNQVIWEMDSQREGGDPSGHSVAQRLEFWKAAVGIIKTHPLVGVGTGDLVQTFKERYVKMNSKLDSEHRLRSHNQYLAITVAFGLLGLMYFLFALLYPLKDGKKLSAIFMLFLIICLISMLTEDTLETQPGATFVGLFFILFYDRHRKELVEAG